MIATGDAGKTGAALRDFLAAERSPGAPSDPPAEGDSWDSFRAERDAYVADEATAAYAGDLRYYTEDDWP